MGFSGSLQFYRFIIFVDDLVEGLIKLLYSDIDFTINLGNPNEFTILELADSVLEIIKSDTKIIYEKSPINDPKMRCPYISKAKKELSWEPTISLNEGLHKTVPWFKNLV